MSRYAIICRLRGPALILLTGVIALLDQMDVLSWGHAWPLYLILWGVLALAERAALAADPQPAYPYAPGFQPAPGYAAGYGAGYAPQAPLYPDPQAGASTVTAAPVTPATTPTDAEVRAEEAARETRKSWEEEGR